MAPSTPSKVCSRCCVQSPISDYIKCGMCKKSFHLCLEQFKKINLTIDLKSKIELSGFRYLCVNCLPAVNTISASYKSIADRLDALTSIVSDLSSIVREMKNPQPEGPSTSSAPVSISRQLFSDVVKESTLVLKPKDANANPEELKNLVINNINPEESNISGIRQTSSNCIILKSCVTDPKAFAEQVDSKLGSSFAIKFHDDEIRRIKIINVENGDSSDEDIAKSIRAQNRNVISDASKFSILRRLPYSSNTNMCSLIVEVDVLTHKNLLSQGKINVKWTRCRVYDALNVIRCLKCARIGHKIADCKNTSTCSKCCGSHLYADCNADRVKCINCIDANEKLSLAIDVSHPSYSHECPTMLHHLKRLKTNLNYNY